MIIALSLVATDAQQARNWVVEGQVTGLKDDLLRVTRRNGQQVILKLTDAVTVEIDSGRVKREDLKKGHAVRVTYRTDTAEVVKVSVFVAANPGVSQEGPAKSPLPSLPSNLSAADARAIQQHQAKATMPNWWRANGTISELTDTGIVVLRANGKKVEANLANTQFHVDLKEVDATTFLSGVKKSRDVQMIYNYDTRTAVHLYLYIDADNPMNKEGQLEQRVRFAPAVKK